MNQLATINDSTPAAIESGRAMLTAADVRHQVNVIQEVMGAVMKKETHYGVIRGTKRPSLFKPGSEVLLTTFRIAVDPEVEDLSSDGEIRYLVRCKGIHQTTGIVVGVGVGECSSGEEKYKWRAAVCQEEFDAADENRRRIKFSKWKGDVERKPQVRMEPADVANTILKMAKKRAQIDLTLTALGASDIFTQDVEDLPPEYLNQDHGGGHDPAPAAPRQPQQRASTQAAPTPRPQERTAPQEAPAKPVDDSPIGDAGPIRVIRAKAKGKGLNDTDLCAAFKIAHLELLPKSQLNDVLKWIAGK